MNLHHLAVFHAVVNAGNVSRAAEALGVSQPAVSKQLRQFERELGVTLLDRLPRGVAPTAAGRVLADHARRVFAAAGEASRAVEELRGLRRGTLSVGASTTIAGYLLPEPLARFARRHREIEVRLGVANTDGVRRAVLDGTVEVGFTEGSAEAIEGEAALEVEPFAEDELVAVVAPTHELARLGGPASLKAVVAGPVVLREPGSGTRAVLEAALASRGLTVRPALSLGSTEAVARAVAAGAGVAFVSRLAVARDVADGRLAVVAVEGFALPRPLHRLRLRGRESSHAATAFLRELGATPTASRPRRGGTTSAGRRTGR